MKKRVDTKQVFMLLSDFEVQSKMLHVIDESATQLQEPA